LPERLAIELEIALGKYLASGLIQREMIYNIEVVVLCASL